MREHLLFCRFRVRFFVLIAKLRETLSVFDRLPLGEQKLLLVRWLPLSPEPRSK